MLLSRKGNFIYLKTHKTGSTSVELALEPYCAPKGHKVIKRNKKPLITSAGIVGARCGGIEKKKDKDHFWNHMGSKEIIKRIGEEEFFSLRRVTSVRNPFRKFVSQFYFRYLNSKYKIPNTLEDTRAAFEDFLFSPYNSPYNFSRNTFLYKLRNNRFFFLNKNTPLFPRLDDYIVFYKKKLVVTHFIRNEHIKSDLKDFCLDSKLDASLLKVSHERDNSSKKKYNHIDLIYNKKLINRVVDLEGWVFDNIGYSRLPYEA